MKCKECGGSTKVLNSRGGRGETIRMRQCKDCKQMFYTAEVEIDLESGITKINKYNAEYYKRIRRLKK